VSIRPGSADANDGVFQVGRADRPVVTFADGSSGWRTYTGACFAKMWGSDFTIRPERSIPFVLGKVEVGTEPFK